MANEDDDNLLADVGAAFDSLPTAEEPAPLAAQDDPSNPPVDETPSERVERERDEAGRFKAKEPGEKRETLTLKNPPQPKEPTETPAAATTDPAQAAAKPTDTPAAERIAPPVEWKGAGKTRWDRLPVEIQQELRSVWDAAATERAEIAPLKELLDVSREHLVREAGSVHEGLRQLLNFEKLSRDNPLGLIQHIAQARGINLQQAFVGGAATPQSQQPQDVGALIARAVSQELQPYRAQFEQREKHQTLSAIESFRADPKHPYFNDVVDHMAGLIAVAKEQGRDISLEDAYDQAVWANPAIRQAMLSKQSEDAAAAEAAKVEKARKAAGASLRGSPLSNAMTGGAGQNATAHDDTRAAAAELGW